MVIQFDCVLEIDETYDTFLKTQWGPTSRVHAMSYSTTRVVADLSIPFPLAILFVSKSSAALDEASMNAIHAPSPYNNGFLPLCNYKLWIAI